jgi:hypothetical protein
MVERQAENLRVAGSSPALGTPKKTCPQCKEEKMATREFFYARSGKSDAGLASYCKICCARQARERRSSPEAKERHRTHSRLWARKNRHKMRAWKKRWRDLNRERHRTSHNEWHARLKVEKPDVYAEIYRKKVLRRKASPQARLAHRMQTRMRLVLKGKNGKSWSELVGYSGEQLVRHIERQFTKGMTWNNMGLWHVDHIVPVSAFQSATADDPGFKACWALTNLRPLWKEANLSKGRKLQHLL